MTTGSHDRFSDFRIPAAEGSFGGSDANIGVVRSALRTAVSFPDVIEAGQDSPVLIGRLLGADGEPSGLRIVGVNGIGINSVDVTPLPGIRVGDGAGGGFVFRRALDKQLVFAPDADFNGIASFSYTVADAFGDEATVLATVSVLSAEIAAPELAFADGTQWTSVPAGTSAAILGALILPARVSGGNPSFEVFEGVSHLPSSRFAVAGNTLRMLQQPDQAGDGSIQLRIVATGDEGATVSTAFEIEMRPAQTQTAKWDTEAAFEYLLPDQSASALSREAAGHDGAKTYRGAAGHADLSAASAFDQFRFQAADPKGTAISEHELLAKDTPNNNRVAFCVRVTV